MDFLDEAGVKVTDQFLVTQDKKFEISKIIEIKTATEEHVSLAVYAALLVGGLLILFLHPLCGVAFTATAACIICRDRRSHRIVLTVTTTTTVDVLKGRDMQFLKKVEDAVKKAKDYRKCRLC
jgi:hypothetical protein